MTPVGGMVALPHTPCWDTQLLGRHTHQCGSVREGGGRREGGERVERGREKEGKAEGKDRGSKCVEKERRRKGEGKEKERRRNKKAEARGEGEREVLCTDNANTILP